MIDQKAELKVGDEVKFRENVLAPEMRNAGMIGRIVDPSTPPPFPSHVWVEFPNEPERAFDRGVLVRATRPK